MFYILANGTNIYYACYRNRHLYDGPIDRNSQTIIALHGGPSFDHKHMVPFWSQLSEYYQVIFIDQRGNGLSDKSEPSKWNLAQWAEDVKFFIDALKLRNKPILAGASFGSYVAQAALVNYPDAFSAAILSDTNARIDFDRFLGLLSDKARTKGMDVSKVLEVAKNWFHQTASASLDEYALYCLPLFDNNPPRKMIEDLEGSIQTPEVMQHFNRGELFTFDFREQLRNNVKCPVLIIAGDCNPYHSEICARELADALPPEYVTLKVFHGAGSPVYNHYPELVKETIFNFLKEKQLF